MESQHDINRLEAELAACRANAKWERRIAEDTIEGRWREKTDVLLAEICRRQLAEEDVVRRLAASDSENKQLRRRVQSLEQTIIHLTQQLQQRADNNSNNNSQGNREESASEPKKAQRKSAEANAKAGSRTQNSYSGMHISRIQNDRGNSSTLKTNSHATTQPRRYVKYDLNGRRVCKK